MLRIEPSVVQPKAFRPKEATTPATVPQSRPEPIEDGFDTAPVRSSWLPIPNVEEITKQLLHAVKASKATRAAQDLWSEPGGVDAVGKSGGAVTRNYREVNAPYPEGDAAARKQLEANRALEAESLAKLTPEERKQYAAVARSTEGNPQARLALQLLAVQGKLAGGPRASDGQTLLAQLHTAATQKNAEGIDGKKLVCELVRELATPSAIAQNSKGTCGPTTVQIKLAKDNPAEYARIVAGLSSERGEVTLANGATVRREEGTATDDGSGRTQSSRLFQAAMMEYADGAASYDNATDTHTLNGQATGGLGGSQVNDLMTALFNRSFTTEEVSGMNLDARRSRTNDIEAATRRGDSVPVAIGAGAATDGSTGCHWVNVTRVDGDRVYYQNPWGQEESMSREEFAQRLRAATLPS